MTDDCVNCNTDISGGGCSENEFITAIHIAENTLPPIIDTINNTIDTFKTTIVDCCLLTNGNLHDIIDLLDQYITNQSNCCISINTKLTTLIDIVNSYDTCITTTTTTCLGCATTTTTLAGTTTTTSTTSPVTTTTTTALVTTTTTTNCSSSIIWFVTGITGGKLTITNVSEGTVVVSQISDGSPHNGTITCATGYFSITGQWIGGSGNIVRMRVCSDTLGEVFYDDNINNMEEYAVYVPTELPNGQIYTVFLPASFPSACWLSSRS